VHSGRWGGVIARGGTARAPEEKVGAGIQSWQHVALEEPDRLYVVRRAAAHKEQHARFQRDPERPPRLCRPRD
jgi:hypothetical protein